MDGSRTRPSSSGITRGRPVLSSRYATRLFVVPRSIPMMRDMSFPGLAGSAGFAERLAEVVDHGAQIGAGREGFLERGDDVGPLRGRGRVPRGAELARDARLFGLAARDQPLALRRQRGARRVVESARARVLQRLLDLEHLLEQLRRSLRLCPFGL